MSNNNGEPIKRTIKERRFIDSYIEQNGNATKAYLAISPDVTRDSAKELGKRMLRKVNLSVTELLDKMGMTDIDLNQKLKEGLDAKKVISVIPIPPKKGKSGTGDLPEADSKTIDFVDVPDFNVRVKYLDMAWKLKAEYPADRSKLELTGKDGMPIGNTITLKKIVYITCPLKSQCPIKEKVEQAGDNYIEAQRIERERIDNQNC